MVKYIDPLCDFFFNYFEIGANKNHCQFQGFICLLNIMLSIWPLVCFLVFTSDIHVVFWMGKGPMVANLLVPVLLFILNIMVQFFTSCGHKTTAFGAKISCVVIFVLLGSCVLGMGAFVMFESGQVSNELINHCGATPRTARLEAEWNKLNAFYEHCGRDRAVTACPGFTRRFPNRVFVEYLEVMEWDFNCVGFCKFMAKPIFNKQADLAQRCSSEVGKHNAKIGELVGTPKVVIGLALIAVGTCMGGYDHL